SEDASFKIILEKNGIGGDVKKFHRSYKTINDLLWSQHAEGKVSKDFLKVERFRKLLEEHNLEADPHQLSDDYLNTLPDQVFLIKGTLDLLTNLHKKIPLVIVTNGIGHVQHKRLANSGIESFIDLVVVSEECGYSKPDKRIFHHTFDLLKTSPQASRILMIGDKLETDILGANGVGIDSCWFNPDNVENSSDISPTYEIEHLLDVLKIL
ncbi:MAG: noncanonical pyrimidine nucleotidase, YjjG family, partial [Alphaproteobacteria bacterium]